MRLLSHRPSPAMVVACLALLVALGGTGYAAVNLPRNSVGAIQLKSGAVTSPKVKDRSLLLLDFAPAARLRLKGDVGQPGPKGDKGDAGAQGIQGAQGVAGVTALEIVSAASASDATDAKDQAVNCPAGKRVLGGGARLTGADGFVALDSSRPEDADTWISAGREVNATAVNWSLTAFALCAIVP